MPFTRTFSRWWSCGKKLASNEKGVEVPAWPKNPPIFRQYFTAEGKAQLQSPTHPADSAPRHPADLAQVHVDHRCAHIAVAEQLLHCPDIRPALQQVRGKRVPQRACGTFGTSAAEQPLVPKASGSRSSGTLC